MPQAASRFLVEGRVQGVGFRWFVFRAARSLELNGWVRNLADGRVEVYACGDAKRLKQLESLLSEGPPRAGVRSVTAQQAAIESTAGFEIR
jgi:acylphosphatase